MTKLASNARVAVRWAERELGTTSLIHGTDQRAGYSILVRTSDDPHLMVNQLLMVTLADAFLSDHSSSEVALLLDVWEVGKTMRWAGPAQRVVVTTQGLRVEPR